MRAATLVLSALVLASCSRISGPSPLPAGLPNSESALGARQSFEFSFARETQPGGARFTHLFSFSGPDGADPSANLTDVKGTLYGTTAAGGSGRCKSNAGCGTVFKITTSGKERVLYSFRVHPSDGARPYAGLINVDGALYGTTSQPGTVFKMTTSGTETVLHHFYGGTDGSYPTTALTDVNGTLYGTTENGGSDFQSGTVFQITTSGGEKVLHRFNGNSGDGANPNASLIDFNGELYGTTTFGGQNLSGTAFTITTSGNETVLDSFKGYHGESPFAGLTDVNGTLYGTTYVGGRAGRGTVFKIMSSGAETVLFSFGGADGAYPRAGLTNINGTLYGTTYAGGGSKCYILYGPAGCGTVFKITTSGAETVLTGSKAGQMVLTPERV